MHKICPRCHKPFECCHDKIETCWCSKIKITPKVYEFISTHFSDCLCKACTEEIQKKKQSNYE
ncbi:cysteine-rich CWC family protein [Halosquirtibacter xylanolyticus]|uniref:cysteine-rich CWC family protein n=1 Tax=Halosquirtibacter xylanolyticus TaxID=3374599 RepID=UPI00374A46D1|nr:cysteine-rich CWC family protein [Prolixibacteraceae bacterium]